VEDFHVAAAAAPARVALVALHCLFIVLSHGRVDGVEACNFVRAIIASTCVQNSLVVLLALARAPRARRRPEEIKPLVDEAVAIRERAFRPKDEVDEARALLE
jgi:hypothetical protein